MTKVYAHRGASGYAPENTLPAFELARDQGADGVELDVQLTADDELVVIHDETVNRTTNGTGWVKDYTLAGLKALDASMGSEEFAGVTIPTLAEVFDVLADSGLTINIELKNTVVAYPGIEEKVLAMIDERDWEHRIVISSFNHMSLTRIRGLGSLVSTGLLFGDYLYQPWSYAKEVWATALHPPLGYVDAVPELITAARDTLLGVNVWTVNDPEDIDRMYGLGVDGIITNYPDRALARRTHAQ